MWRFVLVKCSKLIIQFYCLHLRFILFYLSCTLPNYYSVVQTKNRLYSLFSASCKRMLSKSLDLYLLITKETCCFVTINYVCLCVHIYSYIYKSSCLLYV